MALRKVPDLLEHRLLEHAVDLLFGRHADRTRIGSDALGLVGGVHGITRHALGLVGIVLHFLQIAGAGAAHGQTSHQRENGNLGQSLDHLYFLIALLQG